MIWLMRLNVFCITAGLAILVKASHYCMKGWWLKGNPNQRW